MILTARGFLGLPLVLTVACAGEGSSSDEDTSGQVSPTATVSPATGVSPGMSSNETQPSSSTAGSSSAAGDSTTVDDSTTGTNTTGGPSTVVKGVTSNGAKCDSVTRLGSVSVGLGNDRTIVSGGISNGVLPSSVAKVEMESGGCELLVPRDLFCTSCASSQACAGDDMCVAKPSRVSAGPVSIQGMLVEANVTPNALTLDYSKTFLDPYPAYEAGSALTFRAAGDVIPAFEAEVVGVPKLASELPAVAVKHGEPARLQWNAEAITPDQTSIFVSFSVNVHGAVTGWIECIAPDTGAFDIPAEMVSALIDLGLSGFPRVDLERRSSATVELAEGCIDVYASSEVTLQVEVDGLASCNKDADCAEGQSCTPEKVCE